MRLSESLRHDWSWATAIAVVEIFSPLLREEEQLDARHEVYDVLKAALPKLEQEYERLQHRLRPMGG